MSTLPGFLLRDLVTVEPYLGVGPTFGSATGVQGHVQEGRKLLRDQGVTSETTMRVWLRGHVAVPVGSRVTARDLVCTAVRVDVHTGLGLGTPDHLDVWCERTVFLPTTTLTQLRGEPTVDRFGDKITADTVIASGLPAHILEDTQERYDPAARRGGVIETFTIRLRAGVDVREGDRLRDDQVPARVYRVTSVVDAHSSTGPALGSDDVRVTAHRIGATS